jgi:hypothetical protein
MAGTETGGVKVTESDQPLNPERIVDILTRAQRRIEAEAQHATGRTSDRGQQHG